MAFAVWMTGLPFEAVPFLYASVGMEHLKLKWRVVKAAEGHLSVLRPFFCKYS